MDLLEGLRGVLVFLTSIPIGVKQDSLKYAANYMFLFPVVGALVGFVAGVAAWLMLHVFSSLLVGVLTLGIMLLVTGLHHTDGLLDFGDAVMFQGSSEEKIRVMGDQQIGVGGLALCVIVLLASAFSIAGLSRGMVVQGLVVSEVSAKFSMVIGAWFGRAAHTGLGSHFIEAMHGSRRRIRLVAATFLSLILVLPLLWVVGLAVLMVGVASSFIMLMVSRRSFGGVTGDVLGATNEIARMFSLMAILLVAGWV